MTLLFNLFSYLVNSSPFFSSFAADFLAGFIVLLIASIFLPKYLYWVKRPQLTFEPHAYRKNPFRFSELPNGEFEITLSLTIKNAGNATIDRLYWEVFIEKDLDIDTPPCISHPDNFPIDRTVLPGKHLRIHGYIERPIFPLTHLDFPYEIKIKTKERRRIRIYYLFKTDYGLAPSWAWLAIRFQWYFLLKWLVINSPRPTPTKPSLPVPMK